MHSIVQGDGGEQGDALMPALFCLALRRALEEIQELVPQGGMVFAYLDSIYVICQQTAFALFANIEIPTTVMPLSVMCSAGCATLMSTWEIWQPGAQGQTNHPHD